jgi:hypothetical protein
VDVDGATGKASAIRRVMLGEKEVAAMEAEAEPRPADEPPVL